MRSWQFAVLALVLSIVGGCRSDPAVPILERELRRKEDEIYRLRATVDELQNCAPCREATDGGSKPTAAAESESAGQHRRSSSGTGNGASPPQIELPSKPATEIPESLKGATPVGPKDTEPGHPAAKPPTGSTLPPGRTESDGPSLEKGTGGVTSRSGRMSMASLSASAVPLTPSGDSRRVATILLNPTLTGSIIADDRLGDQGLLVVIEPRDRAGRPIDAPADVNVVVIDPALQGQAAHVARWDFTAAETAAMFRRTGSSQAIHLTTAWPGNPPSHRKLHLFVRYVTVDGRKLEADQPIEVILPGDKTARWTPIDTPLRAERPADREPATDSGQYQEAPTARIPGSPAYTATRSDDSKPHLPVWSPERR